MKITAFWQIC